MNKKMDADTYKVNLEINKEEVLKDIRDIREEIKKTTKDMEFEIKKLQLRRRDILVVKTKTMLSPRDIKELKKNLEKQLHRRVLIIDELIDITNVISYKKKEMECPRIH